MPTTGPMYRSAAVRWTDRTQEDGTFRVVAFHRRAIGERLGRRLHRRDQHREECRLLRVSTTTVCASGFIAADSCRRSEGIRPLGGRDRESEAVDADGKPIAGAGSGLSAWSIWPDQRESANSTTGSATMLFLHPGRGLGSSWAKGRYQLWTVTLEPVGASRVGL